MQKVIAKTIIKPLLSISLGLFCCLECWCVPTQADWREDIGYVTLQSALRDSLPLGANVPISLVEAEQPGTGKYYPSTESSQFNAASDPLNTAVNFFDASGGQSEGVSDHASAQALNFFGNTTSVAPASNQVTVYEANDYINNALNFTSSNATLPDPQNFRVQNFSWIGTFADPNDGTPDPTPSELNSDREALRRFDYAVDENNTLAFVGLNNGSGTLPHFFSHSYNAIAVGRTDGNHSVGLTTLADYGVGRSKPELVVPRTTTSAATSSASSAATFLYSSENVQGTDAANSETMKAIVLAGATKSEFLDWSQIDNTGVWHPLDDTYGAGELNLYNSYLITEGGRFSGSTGSATQVGNLGWDYQHIQPGENNQLLYEFVIPSGSTAAELSIVLTWNAKIQAPFDTGDPTVANLGLELVDASDVTIDLDVDDNFVDGLSQSDVDNVEHLYLTDLAAGTYTLKISSEDLASDFGIAWRAATLFDQPSADFDGNGVVDGGDFFTWQRGFGTLIGASHADGDADGDGDVDSDDLAFFSSTVGPPAVPGSLVGLAVPEPATVLIVVVSCLILLGSRYLRAKSSA